MNNLTEESELGGCLICFSKIGNYDVQLQVQEYQKIVNSCWNYLHENIANSKLQNAKSENELPLCKKCFDATSELFELSEVVIKSEKKISNLSFEFSLGVLARRTQVESVNNLPDGQNSPKDFIMLDVSRISPSLFSKNQTNPTESDDNPCENMFVGMDAALNDPQAILEIVNHESEKLVDEESAESEDEKNIARDEEFPAHTRHVVVSKKSEEANVSKQFNCSSSSQHLQSLTSTSNLKHGLGNETSKKKVGQSSSSANIIHGETCSGNMKKVKKSVEVRGRVGRVGKKEHKCHVCEKVFCFPSDLKKHTRVHNGEKPFKCSFCEKAFSQMGSVKVHERIHTGEKPFRFKCSFCVKSFGNSCTAQRHEKTHTGERPFKCFHCTKKFVNSHSLTYHLRVHTRGRIGLDFSDPTQFRPIKNPT